MMIKLSTLKQIPKEITSNSINSVARVVRDVTAHTSLEKSPAVDTFVKSKSQNYILGLKPKALIQELVSKKTSAFGKDANVFPIPNQENLVLRVEHTALEKIASLSEDIKLVPIAHKENVLAHDNLGLPLYSVVDKNSEIFAKESISPIEALKQKDNIMILKKVTGEHPVKGAFDSLLKLMGIVENEPNVPQYINFHQLGFIKSDYGREAAKKCLHEMKKGGEVTIPANHLVPGSEEFTFTNCETFVENYQNYVKSLLSYLKDVSKMPKESYKEAVDTILMDKNFLIDFQHTNNTFVDLKKQKFNFMDFEFDKTNAKYIYENPVKEFRNVILGKCFCSKLKNPAAILLEDKDIAAYKKYSAQITEKINSVAPDKYKF